MGQTLTHGIYLPDEGERNCYDGLASNWSILDGAVGTVAEHTSQIAGKAPAVHTHTKADITDLFNSANTWTGDNTFSGNNSFNSGLTINNAALLNAVLQNAVKGDVSTTGDFAIFIKDKVNGDAATSLLAVYRGGQDSGGSYAQVNIDTKGNDNNRYNNSILFRINPADNSNNAVLIPQRDKTIDLGTSLNQWKSVYAQSYYYNGTAFTDKFVTTDTVQTISVEKKFTAGFSLKNTAVTSHTTAPSSEATSNFLFLDGNDRYWGSYTFYWLTDGTTETRLQHANYFTSGGQGWWQLAFGATKDFKNVYFKPLNNGTINLGDSTHKWKTLNGINPGALSLPNYDDTTYIDISGSIVPPTGETEINKNLDNNQYTPPIDGWLSIRCDGAKYLQIYRNSYNCPGVTSSDGVGAKLVVTLPVRKNVTYTIRIKKDSAGTEYYQLYPCLGNV